VSCSWRSLFRRGRKISRVQFRKPARALRRQKRMARKRKPAPTKLRKPYRSHTESCRQSHQRPGAEQSQFWGESRLPKSGRVKHSASNSHRHLKRLEPDHPVDCTDHLSTNPERTRSSRNRRVRIRRHGALLFHFTEEAWKTNLGRWTSFLVADGDKYLSGTGQAVLRPNCCCTVAAWSLDAGVVG